MTPIGEMIPKVIMESKAKGKTYIAFEKTVEKLQTALDAYTIILNDRLLLSMPDRTIMGRAEALLRELIANPTAARLRELKSGPRNPHSPFREKK